tara:strand:+ start:2347 stop:2985 length:639 start_codon:yes stop_codon:yes gene_type:complete
MAIEEYGVWAGLAIGGIIVGFVFSKMLSRNNGHKSNFQRLSENQIKRWKIDPEWDTILINSKNPEEVAEKHMNKLLKNKGRNDKRKSQIFEKLEESLGELKSIRERSNSMSSQAEISLLMDVSISLWTSTIIELRNDAEDCNMANIANSYNKRFLNFVLDGLRMPALGEAMDKSITREEIENPHKDNFALIDASMQSLVSEHQEKQREFFGI